MISYFIVVRCRFSINFSSKLKTQFPIIFGHDSFPLKTSPFQVSLLHKSMNCLLTNGGWNTCFYQYFFFTKNFPIFSCKHLVYCKIFLVCGTDSFGGLPCLFFCKYSNIIFLMSAVGCFWTLPVWPHIWYFWISFSFILIQIALVNGYIQWDISVLFNQTCIGI